MSELERLLQKGEVLFSVSDGRMFVRWAKKEGCVFDGGKKQGYFLKVRSTPRLAKIKEYRRLAQKSVVHEKETASKYSVLKSF